MRGQMRLFLTLSTALALAGCGDMHREAGAEVDGGTFGNATMNNSLVQTGAIDAQSIMAQRFAREVPSTITFPFNSSELTGEARAVLDQQAMWMRIWTPRWTLAFWPARPPCHRITSIGFSMPTLA